MTYATRTFDYEGAFHLSYSYSTALQGYRAPSHRLTETELFRAVHTPDGPATFHVVNVPDEGDFRAGGQVLSETWGPGGNWVLDRLELILGLDEGPHTVPAGGALGDMPRQRRALGLRLPKTHGVLELLFTMVLGQLVTGVEHKRSRRTLIKNFSEPAPGPGLDLMMPLSAKAMRELPSASFVPLGVHPKHGELLKDLGWRAKALEKLTEVSHEEAFDKLTSIRGIGAWTANLVLFGGMGDPDAFAIGDYHLKNHVVFTLTGARKGTDAEMVELLEPWRGKRGVVARMIGTYGSSAPRRGPRREARPQELTRWK